ncbi:MAG: chemotaxis protein CheA [Deltaproteobacteria bacterium]|nr:chemotaxis protein CheA [Deltaproteobacteria bacterium]
MSPPVNQDFISEAQEIVDVLNRDLIVAENESSTGGEIDPERVNNLFRSAHSLKGISGMFGFDSISRLAHSLESVLDGMRLGRVHIDPVGLDVLFACVERFNSLIAAAATGEDCNANVEDLTKRLEKVARGDAADTADPLEFIELGSEVRTVLTEYEEHRLKENIKRGRNLYILRITFDLANFDLGLAELDAAVKSIGEVITKLPSSKTAESGSISFDIIVGSDSNIQELSKTLGDDRIEITTIQRKQMVATALKKRAMPIPQKDTTKSDAIVEQDKNIEGSNSQLAVEGSEFARSSQDESASVKSVSQTVRVDIRRLDRLMNLVGELSLTKTAFLHISDVMKQQIGFVGLAVDLHKESRNFERRLSELQAGIMEVRMVPLANLFERMVRVGRKISRELKRQVRIEVSGEHTELDKLIVEDLADPLMHLIRNAIDHGIETPEVRAAAGKDPEGTVRLSALAQGNHVIVEVSDDGGGIDPEKVIKMAVAKKLVTPERAKELTRREIFNLLFIAGFSTRSEVSEYSGRGVGLDIVKNNISQLSGVIDIFSVKGKSTSITVTLPITLAIIPALVVAVAGRTYAIPLNNVLETLAIEDTTVSTIERREVISVRGATVPLVDLRHHFRMETKERPEVCYGVVAGVGQHRMALVVDELVGQQDIVIKSLGRRLQHIKGIAGATELGNQKTILVIDMVALINELAVDSAATEA